MEDIDELVDYHIETETIIVTEKKSYKGLTGFWTKWGGAKTSVATNQWGDVTIQENWYCQSCSREQPIELKPLLFQFIEGERIRVCSVCFNNGCRTLKDRTSHI